MEFNRKFNKQLLQRQMNMRNLYTVLIGGPRILADSSEEDL